MSVIWTVAIKYMPALKSACGVSLDITTSIAILDTAKVSANVLLKD